MIKFLLIPAALASSLISGCAALAEQERLAREAARNAGPIAVLPLRSAPHEPRSGSQSADLMTSQLIRRGFQVVDRTQIERIFREQGFGQSGAVDETSAAKTGKLLGAKLFLSGSVDRWAGRRTAPQHAMPASDSLGDVSLRLRLVEVETGRVVWTGSKDCSNTLDAFKQTVDACAEKVTEEAVHEIQYQLTQAR